MAGIDKQSRKYFDQRVGHMKTERSSFDNHWKEISDALLPVKTRFDTSDRNRGTRRYKSIMNATGTMALRTSTAGLEAGIMSKAQPWFKYEPPDLEMLEFAPVREWIGSVEKLIRRVHNGSNLYSMAPAFLKDALMFGTSFMTHDNDFEDVARFFTHPVGSFYIGQDGRNKVTSAAREFEMTTEQIVSRFAADGDFSNLSQEVRRAWDLGNYMTWHKVIHFIEPNPNFDETRQSSRFKKFRSVHYEQGEPLNGGKFLDTKGFDEFPGYAVRWSLTGGDIYATDCPGMVALGDVRQLQVQERQKAQGIAKQMNPPLTGPASLKNIPVSGLPGGLTAFDADPGGNTLRPVFEVNPQLGELRIDMKEVEQRIKEALHTNLFRAITDSAGIQPRNQLDITRRDEERLLELGPVLQQFEGEFLSPMVNRTFNQLARAGALPPAPPELQGLELDLRFVSSLALAQRAAAIGPIERMVGFVAGVSQIPGKENVVDKFDADQAVDEFGHAIGAPTKLIVADDQAANQRAARAEQQAVQQQAELETQAASAAAQRAAAEGA